MKYIKVLIDVENDRDLRNVIGNVKNLLLDAPVELSFKVAVKDDKTNDWVLDK